MIDVAVDQMLQNIHGNFSRMTHMIPMVQVEDLPEAMQRHVVGYPIHGLDYSGGWPMQLFIIMIIT